VSILAGNIIAAIGHLLSSLTTLYMLIVIASAVITWFPVQPWHPAVRFLRAATEPVYARLRRYMPRSLAGSGIDFTPAIVILGLWFLNAALFRSLIEIGMRMR